MGSNNQAKPIDATLIAPSDEATAQFESHGGHLTVFSPFGEDPLRDNAQLLAQREAKFQERYPDFGPFFYTLVNGYCSLFRDGVLFLIDVSKRLQSSI